MSGYFVVYRAVFEHVDFADEPFTEREAWMWLISEAAWKPKKVRLGSGSVVLERGQVVHSLRFLASRWKWSVKRVRGFIDRSEKRGRLTKKRAHDGSILTICNYDKYQLQGHTEGQSEGTARAHEGHKEEELKKGRIDDDEGAWKPEPLVSSEANEIANEVAKVCEHDLEFLPPAWLGAPYRVQTWIANGWPREIILASCREQMAKKRDGPPDRIQYFEKGIAAAIAKHHAPLPEVKIIEAQTVEVRRGTTENLSQVAHRLAKSGISFGARPSLAPRDQGGGDIVRLLPEGRRERS